MDETDSTKLLVQEGYDKIAKTYLQWTSGNESPRLDFLEKLLAEIPNSSSGAVLEIGCGAGVPGTEFLASRFGTVVANDISIGQINLAKQNLQSGNVEFVQGDMTKLTFSASAFDAVVAFYSIIHLPRQEQVNLFKDIHSWLKPDGHLLCNLGTTNNAGATSVWLDDTKMYWSGFDSDEYLKILTQCGFRFISIEIIVDNEDGREVPFLWVLAQKLHSTNASD